MKTKDMNRKKLLDQAAALLSGKNIRPRKVHVYIFGEEPKPTDIQKGDIVIRILERSVDK